jgi:predicted RNase H-like nuclease (RuvC/YqgF family)
VTIVIDPFEMPPPPPRDTVPTAVNAYDHLEEQILRLEADFRELDVKLRLAREVLDGISSSASALAALYRKDNF